MNAKERFYPEVKFGGFTDIDGTIAFFNRVNSFIEPNSVILDVGCGRGEYRDDPVLFRKNLRILKGKSTKVIGMDVDRNAQDNPFIDEFRLVENDSWPIESESVNLIVCDNVLEHIADPEKFFAETRRVLKNDGYLCIRTPNRWGYISLFATLVPNRYHAKVLSLVQDERKEEDVFPTYYKCNSARKIKKIMKKNGFDCVAYGYDAEPSYLSFSAIAYFFGVVHQRLAPKFFKPTLFAFGKIQKKIVS
jgi:SAM-dependent methyltransferase